LEFNKLQKYAVIHFYGTEEDLRQIDITNCKASHPDQDTIMLVSTTYPSVKLKANKNTIWERTKDGWRLYVEDYSNHPNYTVESLLEGP